MKNFHRKPLLKETKIKIGNANRGNKNGQYSH